MNRSGRIPVAAGGAALLVIAVWILAGASAWIDRPFAGFLVLENGVVASAGLASWPASNDGEIFQHELVSFDRQPLESLASFRSYIESLPIGTEVEYEFARGDSRIRTTVATRLFTPQDALLLFGASFVCAIAFLSVASALLYIAPKDPASLGSALSFTITGVFALTALDLYGPYRFFRIHAVAECFLGAGMLHMALAFPYRRAIIDRLPWLIPAAYAGAASLGIATAVWLYDPAIYVETHRMAIIAAGLSFLAMVLSQILAFVRPPDYATRKRVQILAIGTFASVTPAFLIFVSSAFSGGGGAENLIGWAGIFFPISVAYAVLRSDALQVDAIVRRTVSYAILTVLVGATYASLIGVIEPLIRDQGEAPRWLSILIFSCVCTFGMLPLRDVVQSSVDKLFFRSVYDFRLTIEDTSAILARLTDLDSIRARIIDVVTDALQPESAELVVNLGPTGRGENPENPAVSRIADLESGGISIPFRSSNRVVARLVLGRRLSGRFYSGEDRALLQILANQGAISIENAIALESLHDLNLNLEQRVRERTAELAAALDELRETQVQLVQAERLAAVGELAAGVAHEVNNPLNFARNSLHTVATLVDELSGYAEAIALLDLHDADTLISRAQDVATRIEGSDPKQLAEDLKELVEILGEGLDRTAQLVADLRDFSKPRSTEKTPFNLADAAATTLQLVGPHARELGIETEAEFPESLPAARGDASSMNQVILNVVKNAIDAVSEAKNPKIRLSISHDAKDQELELCVEDNGHGIPPDIAPRIFEPFFTTKEMGKGTGLGLPMCQRVMHEYDGSIRVESDPGRFTRVTIRIPTAEGD